MKVLVPLTKSDSRLEEIISEMDDITSTAQGRLAVSSQPRTVEGVKIRQRYFELVDLREELEKGLVSTVAAEVITAYYHGGNVRLVVAADDLVFTANMSECKPYHEKAEEPGPSPECVLLQKLIDVLQSKAEK